MTQTAIQYTYRRNDIVERGSTTAVHGPVIMSRPDDGRDPMVQAQESCDRFGDTALTAERIPAPRF